MMIEPVNLHSVRSQITEMRIGFFFGPGNISDPQFTACRQRLRFGVACVGEQPLAQCLADLHDRVAGRSPGLQRSVARTGARELAGLAPQLLLEAAMAAAQGFGPDLVGEANELVYWHLSGGMDAGKSAPLFKKNPADIPAAVLNAKDRLADLIDQFDDPTRPYLSCPHPGLAPRFSDYAQLARVAEWSAAGDADD